VAEITTTELRPLLYFGQKLQENGSWYSDALDGGVGNCVFEKET